MVNFQEKIYIVTGASSGIGKETALLINKYGGKVICVSRNIEALNTLKLKSLVSENIIIEPKDLSENISGHAEWVKELSKKYGKLSGIVNCAGSSYVCPVSMIEYEDARKIMDLNYFAPLMLVKGFADRRVNTGKECSVIFISSIAAHIGLKGQALYSGTKSALSGTCRSLAKELISKGIRVNTVSPGAVDTPMLSKSIEHGELDDNFDKSIVAPPQQIAHLVVFLLSNQSMYISGKDYNIDIELFV